MKNLAELKAECAALGLTITQIRGRASKEPYIAALRDHHWRQDHPDEPLPPQIHPMLLGNWADLDPDEALRIEHGTRLDRPTQARRGPCPAARRRQSGPHHQPLRQRGHLRLGEFQDNLPHLTTGLSGLDGTILDGELVFPGSSLDTGRTIARHPAPGRHGDPVHQPRNRPAGFRPNPRTASGSTPSTS